MSEVRKFWTAKSASVTVLIAIAFIAVGILAWAWSTSPENNTLRYEAAKTSMQVIAVAILGSLATLATLSFTQSRTRDADLHDRKLERWQRQVSDLRDQRDRQNEFLRSTLQATVNSYNRVKRERRLLLAETRVSGSNIRNISLKIYDEHMAVLIDQQLEFEQFKRLAPFIDDERLNKAIAGVDIEIKPGDLLAECYGKIENYLNAVIDEYQNQRQSMVGGSVSLAVRDTNLPKLTGFLNKSGFQPGISLHIASILDMLLNALLQPLALPDPDAEDAPTV